MSVIVCMGVVVIFNRPVFALIDVDVYHVDTTKRNAIREDTVQALGPSDPTIVVEEKGDHKLDVQHLLDVFKSYGEIVLVR